MNGDGMARGAGLEDADVLRAAPRGAGAHRAAPEGGALGGRQAGGGALDGRQAEGGALRAAPESGALDGRHADAVCALGVDIGSSNTKVVLLAVTTEGVVRELAARRSATPDAVTSLLGIVRRDVRELTRLAPTPPLAVGIAGMAESGAALGTDDRPLTPLLRWNAERDRTEIDAFTARLGSADLYRATGVPSGPKTPLAIWLHLRKTQPELWTAMRRWAGVADLIALDLTGDLVTDHTFAARTMAYRLPAAGTALPDGFDHALLHEVGVRQMQLPRVARPGEAAGHVTADAAAATGLASGTPVYVCGHDHAVASWAAGARELGADADSMGTSEALLRIVGDVERDAVGRAGMSLSRSVDGVAQTLLAGMAGSGAVLDWWFDRVLPGIDRGRVFAAIDGRPPGPDDVLVLPYPTGRQTPEPDPGARLRVLDASGADIDTADRTPAQLTRGLLAGLSLQLRWMRDEQNRLAGGSPASSPAVVGGPGAANRTWLRIKSEVLGTPLTTVDAAEPVASGAALLALVRDGRIPASTALPAGEPALPAGLPGSDPYATAYETLVAAATRHA